MSLRWVWMLVAVGVLVVAISSYVSSSCGAAAAGPSAGTAAASIGATVGSEARAAALRHTSPEPRNPEVDDFERACAAFLPSFESADFQDDGDVKGKQGGGWSPCTHLKIYGLNFAPFFARFLAYQLQPETTLELGCGLGTTSDFIARSVGASVTCIEPEQTLATLIGSLRKDNLGNGRFRQLALNIFDKEPEKASCTERIPQVDLVFSLEDTSEPHEMLANFMFGGFDFKRFEAQFGNLTSRNKAAEAFAHGSNAAMWPSLTLWEQKAKRGEMCRGTTGRKLAAAGSSTHGGGKREEAAGPEADVPMESAWAWQFYTGALPK